MISSVSKKIALVSIAMMLPVAVADARLRVAIKTTIHRVSKRVLSARVFSSRIFSTKVAKPRIGLKDRYKNFMHGTSDRRFFAGVACITSAPSGSLVGCAVGQSYGNPTKGSLLGFAIPLHAGVFFLAPFRTLIATAGIFGAGYAAYKSR